MSNISESSKVTTHLSADTKNLPQQPNTSPETASSSPPTFQTTKHATEKGRYLFHYKGQKVYEWEQTLEDIIVYIDAPPDTHASNFSITIHPNSLRVALKHHDRDFFQEPLFSTIIPSESSWYLDNDTRCLVLTLGKAHRGEPWETVLGGRFANAGTMDPNSEEIQQELIRERFQEEHPGFDFRDATFSGSAPNPRTFLGGVKYE